MYAQKKVELSTNDATRVNSFKEHIKKGPFYICVCCNRRLYKRTVKKFVAQKYGVPVERYCNIVPSFDGFYYICITCDKKLGKKKVPSQSIFNKLQIFDFRSELKSIRRLERVLIAKRITLKKITIMSRGQSPKLKGALCNVPVDHVDVSDILPRQADSNGIVVIKLKRKLEYRGHVYFEIVRPDFVLRLLQYLRSNNHLYKDVEINMDNIPNELISLNDENESSVDFQIDSDPLHILQYMLNHIDEPISLLLESPETKDVENDSDNELETDENTLDKYRLSADETTLMSNMPTPDDIDNKILNLAPGEGRNPISILNDKYCEELAHPHLFPTGKFGYKVPREIALSPSNYFNQRLLNYTQKFASDSTTYFLPIRLYNN